jgi:hypothetical protein
MTIGLGGFYDGKVISFQASQYISIPHCPGDSLGHVEEERESAGVLRYIPNKRAHPQGTPSWRPSLYDFEFPGRHVISILAAGSWLDPVALGLS